MTGQLKLGINMTKFKLWKFSEDYGRMGTVEGLFIATEEEVDKFLVGTEICFGEILGKHSEVSISFEKKDFRCLDVPESTIQELFKVLGRRRIGGYNPFEYLYNWITCSNCGSEGCFGDWFDNEVLVANFHCPECGSEEYKIEEE